MKSNGGTWLMVTASILVGVVVGAIISSIALAALISNLTEQKNYYRDEATLLCELTVEQRNLLILIEPAIEENLPDALDCEGIIGVYD